MVGERTFIIILMKGFAALNVVVLVVLALVGGGVYFYFNKPQTEVALSPSPSPSESPSASPSATPSPTVTPKPSVVATKNPTPTPTPKPSATVTPAPTIQASSDCHTDKSLGNLVVYIQSIDSPIVGDAAVTMSNGSGDCPGTDSRLPHTQIISQGQRSVTFSGYLVAKYHVKVSYHGNNYDSDVDIKAGDNPITLNLP